MPRLLDSGVTFWLDVGWGWYICFHLACSHGQQVGAEYMWESLFCLCVLLCSLARMFLHNHSWLFKNQTIQENKMKLPFFLLTLRNHSVVFYQPYWPSLIHFRIIVEGTTQGL